MNAKTARAPAVRAPRLYCCPTFITAALSAVLLLDGLESVLVLDAEAVSDEAAEDDVAEGEAELEEEAKFTLVESMVPQVSLMLVVHAVRPVRSPASAVEQLPKAE